MSPSTLFGRSSKRDGVQIQEKKDVVVKPSVFRLYPISSRKREQQLQDTAKQQPKKYEINFGGPRKSPRTELPAHLNHSIHHTSTKEYGLREPEGGWRQPTKERKSVDGMDSTSEKRLPTIPIKGTAVQMRQNQGTGGLPIYAPPTLSSKASVLSQDSAATPVNVTLAPLQPRQPDELDVTGWDSIYVALDDLSSYDLVTQPQTAEEVGVYKLEQRSELLFCEGHLKAIFDDPALLSKFTGFLNSHRPSSIPILLYYLDALKALRAITYANGIVQGLQPMGQHQFTKRELQPTKNNALEEQAKQAFTVMVNADLPAYIAHEWAQIVRAQIERRIAGTLAPHLREASEGLAEVFCLTDPNRPDNPVILASEAFSTVTQYGLNYSIGRNCRFLQGPRSDPRSLRRISEACRTGRPITEVFLNYHRDGSPFMNMLTISPLVDGDGKVRYFLGSQIEVSGLARQCTGLSGLAKLVDDLQDPMATEEAAETKKDKLESLCKMFNTAELQRVRRSGGRMYKEYVDDDHTSQTSATGMSRLVLTDRSQEILDAQTKGVAFEGLAHPTAELERDTFHDKVENIFEQWLLVRPAPSLRIIFTSPSIQVPGIMQAEFFNYVGGSIRVRENLKEAMNEGRGVTAKIRWLAQPNSKGEGVGPPRWIHCTPLIDHKSCAGAWVVVLVNDPTSPASEIGEKIQGGQPVAIGLSAV